MDVRQRRDPGIARRGVQGGYGRILRQGAGDGVLPAP